MPSSGNLGLGHSNTKHTGASQPRASKTKEPRQQRSSAAGDPAPTTAAPATAADAHMPRPSLSRQSTISELFASSQSKSSCFKADSSPNKRQKTSHTAEPMTSSSVAGMARCGTPQKSRAPARPGTNSVVVDLTGSPPERPQQPWDGTPRLNPPTKPLSFQPYAGPKRIEIKNLRQRTETSVDELLRRTWPQLDAALTSIFNGGELPSSREELYRGVEHICRHQGAQRLFEKLRARSAEHVQSIIRGHLPRTGAVGTDGLETIRAVLAAWRRWSQQLVRRTDLFPWDGARCADDLSSCSSARSSSSWTDHISFPAPALNRPSMTWARRCFDTASWSIPTSKPSS